MHARTISSLITLVLTVWVGGCPANLAEQLPSNSGGTDSGQSNNAGGSDNAGGGTGSSSGRQTASGSASVGSVLAPLPKFSTETGAVRIQIVNQSALRFEARVAMKSHNIQVRSVRALLAAESIGTLVGPDNADFVDVQLLPLDSPADPIAQQFTLGTDFRTGDTVTVTVPAELGRPKPPPTSPDTGFDPAFVEPEGVDNLPVDPGSVLPVGGGNGG